MKHRIKTVTWKFCDSQLLYPDFTLKEPLSIRGPEDVYKGFRNLFDNMVRERFLVIWLNSANKATGFEVISEGTLNASLTHPREVYRGAIVATCASIIIAHNHPSGNSEPSREDINITNQIAQAGKIIGIPLHDHIIFTNNSYTSFAVRGLL